MNKVAKSLQKMGFAETVPRKVPREGQRRSSKSSVIRKRRMSDSAAAVWGRKPKSHRPATIGRSSAEGKKKGFQKEALKLNYKALCLSLQ